MTRPPLLVINTYGGSLLIGARLAGWRDRDVVGSYEDAGYGSDLQALNFPGVALKRTREEWPELGPRALRGTVVIAHPPCAAFSTQNSFNAPEKRGVDAAKFRQTVAVLDYALGAGCDALAVESVCGAYEGAAAVHEGAAARHGYELYRVLQNAATFGVPQWRPRFWAIYVRRGLLKSGLALVEPQKVRTVGAVLEDAPSETDPKLEEMLADQRARLVAGPDGLFTKRTADELLASRPGNVPMTIRKIRKERGLPPLDLGEVVRRYWRPGNLLATCARVLDERGFATVILSNTWLLARGRNLSYVEYKRLMGYPDSYAFPQPRRLREFLSRGVCPPVAAWVLETVAQNLAGKTRGATVAVPAGGTADLRPKRGDLPQEVAA